MARAKREVVTAKEGYTLKWTKGEGEVCCDVYNGERLISELAYPLYYRSIVETATAFTDEAVAIARDEEKAHPLLPNSENP